MNQRQENKNSSFLNVEDHFEKNAAVVETLPPLANTVAEIKVVRTDIDALIAKQSVNIGGTTETKGNDQNALIVATVDVSNRLVALATVKKNPVLLTAAKVTDSGLRRLADTKLKGASQGILDLALSNATDALTYGITPAVTDNLSTKLTAFSVSLTKPKLSIDELKQITADLDKAFKQDDVLFKTADKLMKLFKDTNPAFHDSYFNLRKVVNTGKGTYALQIIVKDAATGKGLPKVKLEIAPAEEMSKVSGGTDLVKNVKISSAKGGSIEKSMPDGKYIVTASRKDYASQTITFTKVGGILTNVVINMVKE